MTKMAVVGVGSTGHDHVRVLMDIRDLQLVAVADQKPDRAKSAVNKYGIPVYADYRQRFHEQRPHAVVVAVPTVHHRETALSAFERGIHVLIEKPIAATVEEAQELIVSSS